ncbi:MAG TPA: adenylate/guanylate cyclase domain-containing protein [Candidatus Binatia bacterium]|jgi:adenylate cyclase
MDNAEFAELAAWITEAGLAGQNEIATLNGFCERAVRFGLPIARAIVLADTLHPIYEGRAFRWNRDKDTTILTEYGRTEEDLGRWQRSPFFYLERSGENLLRRRLTSAAKDEFSIFPELIAAGMTDYIATVNRFANEAIIGDMDGIYSSWASDAPAGFGEKDIADLCQLIPVLALTIKAASLARIAETLVETYLGRDAGKRVLQGQIDRGITDEIEAALWFSDLRSYTRIADGAAPGEIIPLLNDYSDAIISAIHRQGGDVLKLIGDGILAIFTGDDRVHTCESAMAAAEAARESLAALNRIRSAENLPVTDMYLALHVGTVFYGNIGSKERLDFTVIGPAVNEVSRIAAMCRSVDQLFLVSSAFAAALGELRSHLVSVGRFALRGVAHPQELYTLDADLEIPGE